MSSPLVLHPALPTLDEDAWEDLLNFIEERRVVPIIGPELLQVETESGARLLYEWVAERLAGKLAVDTSQLPQPYTLNDVVCWFLASRGRREEAYTRLRSIFRDASFAPPLALRQLAQITDFDLFVTTTFDPLLEQAINAERFAGAQSAEVVAYAPNRVADLPAEREKLTRPVIYHLFGRLSASPTYVISDEDTLEFICALKASTSRPRSCSTSSSTIICCSSAAASRTGSRSCSCAWQSGIASRTRATSAKCSPTTIRSATCAS
jgi:hypothetical protein